MTRDAALAFARRWVATWNARDLETMLSFFADDVVFTSPHASARIGVPTVTGKVALRGYWAIALTHIGSLEFVLDHACWDEMRRELAIVYARRVDGSAVQRASELLRFGPDGRIVWGEAFYGAEVPGETTALA